MALSSSDPDPAAQQQALQEALTESARLRQESNELREAVHALLAKSSHLVEQSKLLEQRLKDLS
jgi:hypothetical protein